MATECKEYDKETILVSQERPSVMREVRLFESLFVLRFKNASK